MSLPFTNSEPAGASGLADHPGRLPSAELPSAELPSADRPSAAPRAGRGDRLAAAIVALVAGGVLAVAASLTPDGRGFGTHQQLGMPACSSEAIWGRPCPSCGMTTAFACFVRGDLLAALRAQVLGAVLAGATLLTALGGAVMAATGVDFGPLLRRIFVDRLDWLYVMIVLGLGSWALKMYIR